MPYTVTYTSSLVTYDTLKPSLLIEDDVQAGGDASVSAKGVTTMAGSMPVRVSCNTVSSLTFGGSVRGWTVRRGRVHTPVTHELDCDDWRTYLDRVRPSGVYTSVAVHSVVRALVAAHTTSFTVEINSYFKESITAAWPAVTVSYDQSVTFTEAMDSLTVLARTALNYDPNQPPIWGVGADRVVRMVGYANSYGTTVPIDDTDADLRGFEIGMVGNQIVSRMWMWGGSTTAPAGAAAGASSIIIDDNERFYGAPSSISTYAGAAVYLANGSELIPVVTAISTTGQQTLVINSLNLLGAQHTAIPVGPVRAVTMVPAAVATLNAIGSLTGESPYWDDRLDAAAVYGNAVYPTTNADFGHALLRVPGQEIAFFRCWTVNSQVGVGGRLAVSLTAAGIVPGLYTIRRVSIKGFDHENIRPIYEVEAGTQARYRIDSLL